MKESQAIADVSKGYSIKDAAMAMAISEASVKAYKATLTKAFQLDLDIVMTESRSLNQYGFEQLKEVQKYHKLGCPEAYVALVQKERPELSVAIASDVANSVASKAETLPEGSTQASNMSSVQLPSMAMTTTRGSFLDLGHWQSQEILAVNNPLSIATDLQAFARMFKTALEQDLEVKEQQFDEQKQAVEIASQVEKELERASLLYEVRQGLLAEKLDATTRELVQKATKIQSMGKSQNSAMDGQE